ncbi:hypothetical protein ACFL06_01565 [Patescibacteria group bacterium]
MTQHGGKRPRSGRKKGSVASHTLAAQEIRICLIEEVLKAKRPIVKALVDKAKKGDVTALREILDRSLGKVKEREDPNDTEKRGQLLDIQNNMRELIERAKKRDAK